MKIQKAMINMRVRDISLFSSRYQVGQAGKPVLASPGASGKLIDRLFSP